MINYAPAVATHLAVGVMTVDQLASAAVTLSDNAAANLLLPKIGGPEGLTRFVRGLGDEVTRFDRTEPSLNSNLPGDPRDTTSPRAMVGLLRRLLCDADASVDGQPRAPSGMAAGLSDLRQAPAGRPAGGLAGGRQDRQRKLATRSTTSRSRFPRGGGRS